MAFAADTRLLPEPPPQMAPYVLEGVISAIIPQTGAITLVFPNMPQRLPEGFFVNNLTRILKNGQIAPFSALAIGDWCRAEIRPTTENVPLAVSVQARTQQPPLQFVRGKITVVDATAFKFSLLVTNAQNPNGVTLQFFADKETRIRKNGNPVGFGDLKVEDFAEVGFVPSPAASPVAVIRAAVIEARTPSVAPPPGPMALEGVITLINADRGSITLGSPPRAPARPPVTFLVNDATKIMKNGQPAQFSALVVGDICRAEVKPTESGLVALNVRAKSAI